MDLLAELNSSVFHLMAAAAKEHKDLTGAQIACFLVPPFVMDQLKSQQNWQQSINSKSGYIEDFAFYETAVNAIYMIEVGCTHPYEVLS